MKAHTSSEQQYTMVLSQNSVYANAKPITIRTSGLKLEHLEATMRAFGWQHITIEERN